MMVFFLPNGASDIRSLADSQVCRVRRQHTQPDARQRAEEGAQSVQRHDCTLDPAIFSLHCTCRGVCIDAWKLLDKVWHAG